MSIAEGQFITRNKRVIQRLNPTLRHAIRSSVESTGTQIASINEHCYYPLCPVLDLTLGTTKHSNISFLTSALHDKQGCHCINVPK
ncbi:Isopenicillin N synthase-like [Parasponia andersonii]|uniref:Isopenicillin N synthase-like n=1 Tax=Parasponia andersonii TaxID=3476 RepID=A0A2P5CNI5_PARAD|nr:Isopenicillin N synthase-like [Parasponia andersonii]